MSLPSPSQSQPSAPLSNQDVRWQRLLQSFLGHKSVCFFAGAMFLLGLRFVLLQWVLSGGYPVETMMGNLLAALAGGGVLGVIEGRVTATHQESQQILGMPLQTFNERF